MNVEKNARKFTGLISVYQEKTYQNSGNLALLDLLPSYAKKVLDVGCGSGDNARILRQRGCCVWGITLSEMEAKVASRWCENVYILNAENEELPFSDESFDAIILSHVLEHMARPKETLVQLVRYLQRGGVVLAAVPNMAYWKLRLRFLSGNWEREETGWMDRTHLQFWSFNTAPQVFQNTPLVLQHYAVGDPTLPLWPLRHVFQSFCKRLDHKIGSRIPNFSAIQVLMVAKKPL
jgi:ubiquinone/menaquinone biosynthesis C-methylase UbiE